MRPALEKAFRVEYSLMLVAVRKDSVEEVVEFLKRLVEA